MIKVILILLTAYLLGSIPTAFILTRIFKKIDITKVGSGNPGTTNVIRTAGVTLGIVTFIIDFLKGLLPVLIAKRYLEISLLPLVMFTAVVGHIYSVFLSFRGGKGVATFFGALLGISPKLFIICVTVFLLVMILTHIVSVSSIITVIVFMLVSLIYTHQYRHLTIFFIITSVIIIFRHISNIRRLLQGKEKPLF